MFRMTQDQLLALAILIVCVASLGGIIGGILAWWRAMNRGLTDGPRLVNGLQRTAAGEQPGTIAHDESPGQEGCADDPLKRPI